VPNRSIIAIEGRDTIKLLQGLITNNIKELHRDQSMYCAFLNPQGRMLSSAFIFSSKDDCALVDLDSNACAGLLAFIKRFKLRSKVTLKDVSEEYQVWATWGKGAQIQSGSSSIVASGHDNRSPLMGHRFITSKDTNESNLISSSDAIDTPESYTIHRILQGVPDGSNDIWENQSLPLEANADFMNAVDFRKGCYVGQELTARTHHTGVVRKRVIPFSFYTSSSSPPDTFQVDTNVSITLPEKGAEVRSTPINDEAARGKSTGKYLSGVHNIGLALLRLDQVHRWNKDLSIKVKTADDKTLSIRPWIPSWWPKEAQEPLE
jgi:folate-binding protein YgfZ